MAETVALTLTGSAGDAGRVYDLYAAGDIGGRLDGDYAYISDAYLVADPATESGLAIRTGTAPWDEDDSAGNDSSDLNNTVRSFDVITYTAAFETQVREDAPYSNYETGTVHYEFVAEGSEDQVRFETEFMGWMTAKAEGEFEIAEETHGGKTWQVLRGSFLAEPSIENPSAIGNSYQELNVALRVLTMKQGDTAAPRFTFWLEGNDVPKEGLVTGSGNSCDTDNHGVEYKTIDAPNVTVTSTPRYNVQIVNGHSSVNQTVGSFDFSTGNDLAQNKNAGMKEGRIQAFGAVIQIVGKSAQHGLRGCELPDGSPITFDLSLTSSYRSDAGETIPSEGSCAPLLWSIDGNMGSNSAATQADGRDLSMVTVPRSYNIPTNKVEDQSRWGCFDGGRWTGVQTGGTIKVTISDYHVDLEQLPYNNIVDLAVTYRYYNPNSIGGYWDVQTACFSAGEIWVVQPFYDSEGNYITDNYGSGSFSITLEDANLQMAGVSGTVLEIVSDNLNQSVQTDDRAVQTSYLSKPGSTSLSIRYIPYTEQGDDGSLSLTEGCRDNGKDWILRGGALGLNGYFSQGNAEGQARIIAADYLVKFDDSFFEPERVRIYDSSTVLYGAKTDKKGWEHGSLQPDEAGYDAEMMQATADDLIFFSSLNQLKEQGYICVAVLTESRRLFREGSDSVHLRIFGNSKDDSALVGNTYMITQSGTAWNRSDIKAAAAEWCKKPEAELTEEDYLSYVQDGFPSRKDITTPLQYAGTYPAPSTNIDYHSSEALKNYVKAQYDENGYVTGTSGAAAGDSCLVVDYATQITKSPNQPGTGEGGKKLTYDMDTSQREADYVLYPTAIRSRGESVTGGAGRTTTVYVEDTLPEGLDYIIHSAYYGGAYTSNGGGKAGTVTGGQGLSPAVTKNTDGTTTLLFTLENVTITAAEVTQLAPIYYSCTIGTPGNEETDVVNQQQLTNSVRIWSEDEQMRDFVATNGNYAEQSILISKNRGVSFSKTSDQKIVELGDEMGFTIHHGNNSSNSIDVVDIDFLPYNGDGRGTQITGPVEVSELTVQSGELIGDFQLYYTTDTAKRNTTAADYRAEDFTEENGWTELTVDVQTGAVELPSATHRIVAVAAVGTLPPNRTLKMHITFDVPDGRPGEFLVNNFGSGDMESNARTYIVDRLLEGIVWLDADGDGLRGFGETLLNGVKVTLLEKGGDGTYSPYLLNGKAVSVETGMGIDVLTGKSSAHADGAGAYGFYYLPEGDFAVRFESGSRVKIDDCTATLENVGADDTIDSDAAAAMQDGKLVAAVIEGIGMPAAREMDVQTYESRHHDLGLCGTPVEIPEFVPEPGSPSDSGTTGSRGGHGGHSAARTVRQTEPAGIPVATDTAARTGDPADPALWAGTLAISCAGLVAALIKERRKRLRKGKRSRNAQSMDFRLSENCQKN
ncbi:MAG: SdrD B-like domain-containing protein [Eubacteriales bacterium]|nr:SdrD B-like domain-containing protein [Eubacteriales bacterium]